ncbi:MAG: ACT domain-containing protein, partial [Thermodesulfobacteriota bacterium]|nr:ACT domain-containing protein [Thermodesulfobacteriota bacterium]
KDTLETHYIEKVEKGSRIKKKSDGGVKIRNVDDVLVHFGKCCNPLPGNSIVGFITRGNGVTIHTFDCQNIVEADPDRVIEASWDLSSIHVRPVKIKVTCWDKKGLLADLSYAISKAGINITKARVQTTLDKRASNIFEIEVKDLNQLNTIINSLKRVDGVVHVERLKT